MVELVLLIGMVRQVRVQGLKSYVCVWIRG
jgi:hypothetical protein